MYDVEVNITMKSKEKDWLNSTMTGSKGLFYNTALLERQTAGLEASTHSRTCMESCSHRERVRFKIRLHYYTKSNINLKYLSIPTLLQNRLLFSFPQRPHSYINNKEARKHIRSIMISFEISILNRSILLCSKHFPSNYT